MSEPVAGPKPKRCPECKADVSNLRIGLTLAGVSDTPAFYCCPECGYCWQRWSHGRIFDWAAPHIAKANAARRRTHG